MLLEGKHDDQYFLPPNIQQFLTEKRPQLQGREALDESYNFVFFGASQIFSSHRDMDIRKLLKT